MPRSKQMWREEKMIDANYLKRLVWKGIAEEQHSSWDLNNTDSAAWRRIVNVKRTARTKTEGAGLFKDLDGSQCSWGPVNKWRITRDETGETDYTGPWLLKLGRYWGLRPKCASGDGRQQEKTPSITRIDRPCWWTRWQNAEKGRSWGYLLGALLPHPGEWRCTYWNSGERVCGRTWRERPGFELERRVLP